MTAGKVLPLQGSRNTRDLGGYTTADKRETLFQKFLRSDSIHNLSDDDKKYLLDYGVRCIIDLRGVDERKANPYDLGAEVEQVHFPLYDNVQSAQFLEKLPASLEEMYIGFLEENKSVFLSVFRKMMEYQNSCVLFHCTAGKDRTGVVGMLLLMLAGVDEEQIASDYGMSAENIKDMFEAQKAMAKQFGMEIPEYLFASDPETMLSVISYLNNKYENCAGYLTDIGLSQQEIIKLKKQLCG